MGVSIYIFTKQVARKPSLPIVRKLLSDPFFLQAGNVTNVKIYTAFTKFSLYLHSPRLVVTTKIYAKMKSTQPNKPTLLFESINIYRIK